MVPSLWENEWRLQKLKEETYFVKYVTDRTANWVKIVEKRVPATMQNTLESAFQKAFIAVFDKGPELIEKTYNKKKQLQIYDENECGLQQDDYNSRRIKKFERQAQHTVVKNLMISSLEGIGLGLLGVGLPDIPLFVSVLLKSIYEISISYGFDYKSDKEKLFILYLIETSLKSGTELRRKDEKLNCLIESYNSDKGDMQIDMEEFVVELQIIRQIDDSAKALSKELLYGKFVQSMTLVGVVGGTADIVCLKRVTDYAKLKYKRRFLLKFNKEIS